MRTFKTFLTEKNYEKYSRVGQVRYISNPNTYLIYNGDNETGENFDDKVNSTIFKKYILDVVKRVNDNTASKEDLKKYEEIQRFKTVNDVNEYLKRHKWERTYDMINGISYHSIPGSKFELSDEQGNIGRVGYKAFKNKILAHKDDEEVKQLDTIDKILDYCKRETKQEDKVYIEEDEYNKKQIEDIYKKLNTPYELTDTAIVFPAINEEIQITDKNRDSIEKSLKALHSDKTFNGLFKQKLNEQETITEDEEEDDYNIFDDSKDQSAMQKELDVAKGLNNLCNQKNKDNSKQDIRGYKFYSGVVGGSARSDVLVVRDKKEFADGKKDDNKPEIPSNKGKKLDTNMRHLQDDDRYFYVEVKKDYESASYFKFKIKIDFSGKKCSNIDIGKPKGGHSSSINDDLFALLKHEFENDKNLKAIFSEMKVNIDKFFVELNNIKPIKKKFSNILGMKNSFSLPDDVKPLSKIFNFYITEWLNKLVALKSTYIYDTLKGDTEELESIGIVVDNVKDKLKKLAHTTDIEKIKNKNYFEKFNDIFSFITDKQTFVDSDFILQDDDANVSNIYKLINDYYANDKDVRYIEIGKDVYIIEPDVKEEHSGETQDKSNVYVMGENPLNLDAPKFLSIDNQKHKIRVYCSPRGDLYLNIFIDNPRITNKNNMFETINMTKTINDSPFFNIEELKNEDGEENREESKKGNDGKKEDDKGERQ